MFTTPTSPQQIHAEILFKIKVRGRSGHDCKVVGFTTIYESVPISTKGCEFESSSRRGVLDTT